MNYEYDWFKPFEEAPEQEAPARPTPYAVACRRYPVAKLSHVLPLKYFEQLEQNQQVASCCRHPENHEVEAWYSSEADKAKRIPDIYINYCTCGRRHYRFCVGGGERPFWDIR
jgi:hypothetical protein